MQQSEPVVLQETDLPQAGAVVKKISIIWLIPLVAGLIGLWLGVTVWFEKGPLICITFENAQGMVAGKTRVKYKDVDVGEVESLNLASDLTKVQVWVRMNRDMSIHLTKGTQFWVVRPELSIRGVTGLGTLMSGVYIEMDPGSGEESSSFIGLDDAPVVRSHEQGYEYILIADRLSSLSPGSAVFFRGIKVGEVLGYELAPKQDSVRIHIFVKSPYHKLVRQNTLFWNANSIDFSLGSNGLKVKAESLEVLLMGGIAFETPPTLGQTGQSENGAVFKLYKSNSETREPSYTRKELLVAYFDRSVRGLEVGANVEFRGIKVGSVKDVRVLMNPEEAVLARIPVLLEIEPERFLAKTEQDKAFKVILNQMVQQGLKGQLRTDSLLTGRLYVELDFFPGTPAIFLEDAGEYPELPTVHSQFDEITDSLSEMLEKIQTIPVETISLELVQTLKGANKMINDPAIPETIAQLNMAVQELRKFVSRVDHQIDPLATNVGQTLEQTRKALEEVQVTLGVFTKSVAPDSALHRDMLEALRELAATAKSIRALSDSLKRNPESLIFGRESKESKESKERR
ncbi:MAG: MlaD family protein [Magnetococcus sp. DMHC-6]